MSTGLTWVLFVRGDVADPSLVEDSIVFNDYNEAISFGDWFMRCYVAQIGPPYMRIFIYTTSPNSSGYYEYNGGPSGVFVPFD